MSQADPRTAELAAALAAVRARLAAACLAANRGPGQVRLLAVSKTFPARDVARLVDLGLTEFGESREPEAGGKVAALAGLRPEVALRWHLIGRLQRNKASKVAGWAAVVHSVDSGCLVDALAAAVGRAAERGLRTGPLEVLVQASLDGDPRRGGCPLPGLPALADRVAGVDGLVLRGLMAVAPLGADPDRAFAALAASAARLRRDHPGASEVSAGMTADLEAAVRHGSTCVRVGTALLGARPLASP